MNEKLTIQDLIDLLAAKHSMTKKDAEAFVKEFFLLIEQALENEKIVKIRGLGTFKLVDVDSRESVHVNTGERFQIKGHTKVSFNPDTSLRDIINKPFAHFETVVLNENTILEDTPMEDNEDDESGEELPVTALEDKTTKEDKEPETVAEETVTEEVVSVSLTENSPEEAPLEEEQEEIVVKPEPIPIIEEPVEVAPVIEEPATVAPEELKEVTAEVIIAQELQKAKLEPLVSKTEPENVKAEIVEDKKDKNEKSPVPFLIATIIIVLLLCGGAILFIYYPDLFAPSSDKYVADVPEVTQPIEPETQIADTLVDRDTVAPATVDMPSKETEVIQAEPVVKEEPMAPKKPIVTSVKTESKPTQQKSSSAAYLDSATYKITGTKTKYTIKEGETLTRVSLHFYGTKAMWPYIVKHNPKVIKNPNNVPYGTTIEIPELTKE